MKFAVTFGRMHPRLWAEAAETADRLGFESAWLPEHLVLPLTMAGSPFEGAEHPPVPPDTQLFDPGSMLSFLAARTSSIRLGTYVYLLGLRHPFITARAFGTLDWLSNGRALIGAGAGWLRSEWEALGIDPATRGARLDEAIAVCRRLWTEETVAHDGPTFPFAEVAFEPKPTNSPSRSSSAASPRSRCDGPVASATAGSAWAPHPSPPPPRWRRSGATGARRGGSTRPSRSPWGASAPPRTTCSPGRPPGWTASS